jgi:AraC-like DNA-binding protein
MLRRPPKKLRRDLKAAREMLSADAVCYVPALVRKTARAFNMRPSAFTTAFGEWYGLSPSRYVAAIRIERAKTMLREQPDLPVWEVAAILGYATHATFASVFRRETGMTPSAYRDSVAAMTADGVRLAG